MTYHRSRVGDLISDDGEVKTREEAQEMIRQTIERTGRFLLSSPIEPVPGEIRDFAGLPFRFVRFVTREEADADAASVADIWGSTKANDNEYHFEVEVAD